jgi:hypothetical protein
MKKIITLRNTLVATAVVLTAFTVTLLISNANLVSSGDDGRDPTILVSSGYWDGELRVGRYLHTSGDESMYVEVFDDGTIQVFGYCRFAETALLPVDLNRELYTDIANRVFGEGNFEGIECLLDETRFSEAVAEIQVAERANESRTRSGVDVVSARDALDGIARFREHCDWFNERHSYEIAREVNFIRFGESPFGLGVRENGRVLIVSENHSVAFAG